MINRMKPGPGWSHAGGAVYDHVSGLRVHVSGLCRLPGGISVNGSQWPEVREMERFIAINGHNQRRGAMAWGLSKLISK
jgi:hypothetical protein